MSGGSKLQDRFDASLLNQRLAQRRQHTSFKSLYGHKEWVEDLDIINELGGHSGCVNALSWSKSGRLLASGSDDTHLNIWSYNPDSVASPFTLETCVSTGHVANIFSTKFMPHSNDRTVVTCAGDSEVRVFDIERGGASGNASEEARAASTRSQRFQNFFATARFLNDGNTNARVYKSHADRVKRIVTESSPYLFLTCSEDGEVRQWDLRQPSSAYPAPRGAQGFMNSRYWDEHDVGNAPPPLISYKRFNLDLNTISCSPSQPYYIALGGAHLHCFLHDRRMTGRNVTSEWGMPTSVTPEPGSHEDELMGAATRCVRRFAPDGKHSMAGFDNGHITACKISDANPNEMIISWSGDHVYSFDIVQSPDARDAESARIREYHENQALRAKQARDRKRKRHANSTTSLNEPARAKMALRREGEEDEGEISLRVRYGNGQSENIPINPSEGGTAGCVIEQTHDSLLTESQKLSHRIAKALVRLRKTLFDLQPVAEMSEIESATPSVNASSSQLTPHTSSFTSALGDAATLLPLIRRGMAAWRYPMNPTRDEVAIQKTMRKDRQASERLVQAGGTLARALGGKLQTMDPDNDERLDHFQHIRPASLERDEIDQSSQFAYDFLKAILLWLEGGREALINGFKKAQCSGHFMKRFPVDDDDRDDAIETKLIPYLSNLASEKPVINIDASRFEVDENRVTFPTQAHAVQSFARAVDGYDLGWTSEPSTGPNGPRQSLCRGAAHRFWGIKVGRSLLMAAGEGVNYGFVNRAFGGVRIRNEENGAANSMDVERSREDIDVNESDPEIQMVSLENRQPTVADETPDLEALAQSPVDAERNQHHQNVSLLSPGIGSTGSSQRHAEETSAAGETPALSQAEANNDAKANDDGDADDADDADDDDDEDTFESDSDDGNLEERIIFRNSSGFGRNRHRRHVDSDTPCGSHTRIYKGHCNIKTVKDVNFYGLNDEYVISGSDDGNLFIWDRKTSNLLNILEGDGEVVNVIQGHPYEPMIAASGIDSTIKIFSPDAKLQDEARRGQNIANPGGVPTSSLRLRRRASTSSPQIPAGTGLASRRRMDQSYQITSRNDMSRQSGVGDAFLTRSMIARLAASINSGQAGVQGGQIIIDDNCLVM